VWGKAPPRPYTGAELEQRRGALRAQLPGDFQEDYAPPVA
jgi:hypothetical protein